MLSGAGLKTLPNLLSFSRVFLAAAFVMTDQSATRLGLVIAAGISDFLDGWLARRANVATRLGALIDPIADRVFVLIAVSTFLFEGALSTLGYFIMISRDLMTTLGFLVARSVSWLRPVQFKARLSGKVVTALQLAALVALIEWPTMTLPLLWCVGIASAVAVVDYTVSLWRARAV